MTERQTAGRSAKKKHPQKNVKPHFYTIRSPCKCAMIALPLQKKEKSVLKTVSKLSTQFLFTNPHYKCSYRMRFLITLHKQKNKIFHITFFFYILELKNSCIIDKFICTKLHTFSHS